MPVSAISGATTSRDGAMDGITISDGRHAAAKSETAAASSAIYLDPTASLKSGENAIASPTAAASAITSV